MGKKQRQNSDLCTLVAFTPVSSISAPLEVEALRPIKQWQDCPMEIQVQDKGLFFTDAQAMENNDEVVSPIASEL